MIPIAMYRGIINRPPRFGQPREVWVQGYYCKIHRLSWGTKPAKHYIIIPWTDPLYGQGDDGLVEVDPETVELVEAEQC